MIAALMGFRRNVLYTEGEVRLPYALERIEGADRLVVLFPKLAPGEVRPAFGLRRMLGDFHAHRLYLGGDEHSLLGPKHELRGLKASVRQVQATMDKLRIPREDVICLGSSAGAVLALLVGLECGCGTIIAGAPVFDLGHTFAGWERTKADGKKAHAVRILQDMRGGLENAIEFLDSLIPSAVAQAGHHSRIVLFTSLFDYGYLSTREFAERYDSHPLLTVECTVDSYPAHGGVGPAFREFLQEQLPLLAKESAARPG